MNRERYRGLGARLWDAGFELEVNAQGNKRLQARTIGTPHTVTMDFLIPPGDESDEGGAIPHIESDLAAKVTLGLELAFKDRCWKGLPGSTPAAQGAFGNKRVKSRPSDRESWPALGLELAFKDRCWKGLPGSTPAGAWVTRIIPLCSLGVFTVLKAHLGTAQRTKMPMTSSTVGSRLFTCG